MKNAGNLGKVGIDPFFSPENLIWAPKWSHTEAYALAVHKALMDTWKTVQGKSVAFNEQRITKGSAWKLENNFLTVCWSKILELRKLKLNECG